MVQQARRRDDFVRGIAAEIQKLNRPARLQVNGPDVQSRQQANKFRIIEVQFHAAEELAGLPNDIQIF